MRFKDLFEDDFSVKWDLVGRIPEFAALKGCKQSSTWHMEGDVWNHAVKVVDYMKCTLPDFDEEENAEQRKLVSMAAALCHDLGKPRTTYWDRQKSDWACRNHGDMGEKITRDLFREEDFGTREKVCFMVRNHMALHHVLDDRHSADGKIARLSQGLVPLADMINLNVCDSMGSENKTETVNSFKEKYREIYGIARRLDCLTKPYKFPTRTDRRDFNARLIQFGEWEGKEEKPLDGCPAMYVMIGVSGSGKSTYVKEKLADRIGAVLSRDGIRKEFGIIKEDWKKAMGTKEEEAKITSIFNERLAKLVEERESFAIDNTNLYRRYRDGYKAFLKGTDYVVTYVFMEPPSLEECENRRKGGGMPDGCIKNMWISLEFPDMTECDNFIVVDQRQTLPALREKG